MKIETFLTMTLALAAFALPPSTTTWTKVAERTLDIYRGIAPFRGSEIERPNALASAS